MPSSVDLEARRYFLSVLGATAVAAACGSTAEETESADDDGGGGSSGVGGAPQGTTGGGSPPMVCTPSADNILGPYYRAGAPFRSDLTEANTVGTRITVSGRVLDPDCQPIADTLLDIWQADDGGGYDNDGTADPPPDQYVLRGRVNADADGAFSFRTIVPGRYLNGAQFRPAHVHITVSAPGFQSLTTQLYFEGDPYNAVDAWYLPELELTPEDAGGELVATFDFVLSPA